MFKNLLFLLLLLPSFAIKASHGMGGEITYKCVGGNSYVFELIFYRDCNGAEINISSENIRVWRHPSVTTINLPFVSREDISPKCSPVVGSPPMLACGVGSAGGNGIGAIERITYRSAPITLLGTPPADGWVFTYENFSRSGALTNILNPTTYGITIKATMYAIPGSDGLSCLDSSPIFLQEPYFVSCAESDYRYNMNAVDPDLDSIHFDFGIPYNYFPTGIFDPPNNPIEIPFESGFSYTSPTPGTNLNPSNVPAVVDPLTGELTFKSYTIGNYVVKLSVKSYRQGILISEVEREMQLIVVACNAANNAPVIVAPFPGNSFETNVNAGDPISFNLNVTDTDLLQDLSAQTVYLTASGPMFGTNFTLSTGCDIEPCAYLNSSLPISGTAGVSATFNWQTDCDHLVNQYGIVADVIPYNFVFKVQDNYCQVPKVYYTTVTINVLNPGIITATEITCIETDLNGDLIINWNSVNDPNNTFASYEVHSVQNGLLTTITDISETQYTISGVTGVRDFYVTVRSGCDGNVSKNSDTVSNIRLNVNNPLNGTAVLQWNKPRAQRLSNFGNYYHLYREYPVGTFTFLDSVPYNTTLYKDTIDICSAFISYKVELPTTTCDFTSNIMGDDFVDMLTPNIPMITSVGVDTSNNNILLTWNENPQPDTYGYVIYTFDANGFLFELDTVWGRPNTTYTYSTDLANGPFSYSVAAFDSCFTTAVPITYQTSAKSTIQTSMTLNATILMCEHQAILQWSPYVGKTVASYEFWGKTNNQWELLGTSTTTGTEDTANVVNGQSYCVYVKAIFNDGFYAFSSPACFTVPLPQLPSYHYFKLATIENKEIKLFDYIDASVGISQIIYQRKSEDEPFTEIGRSNVTNDVTLFIDKTANTKLYPWEYRTQYVDSCGYEGTFANTNKTVFVTGTTDEYYMINTINWTAYEGFNGQVINYDIFRSVNGVFDVNPIATVQGGTFSYVDDVSQIQSDGKICYHVEAVEALNFYNFAERSRSNDFCFVYAPLVFVPNAFTPGGFNPIFKPILSNVSTVDYTFTIINRWGQEIFSTHDPNEGWDGKINVSGGDATSDVFSYIITYQDQNEDRYVKRGCVALLR